VFICNPDLSAISLENSAYFHSLASSAFSIKHGCQHFKTCPAYLICRKKACIWVWYLHLLYPRPLADCPLERKLKLLSAELLSDLCATYLIYTPLENVPLTPAMPEPCTTSPLRDWILKLEFRRWAAVRPNAWHIRLCTEKIPWSRLILSSYSWNRPHMRHKHNTKEAFKNM